MWDRGRHRPHIDPRLLWIAVSYSTLQWSYVLQQAYTCSHSRLNSHIYYFWNAHCTCTHIHKVNTIAFGFIEKVKMCGNYFWVASAIAGSSIYHLWSLLLPCVPDMLKSSIYGVLTIYFCWCFCSALWEHFPAVDCLRWTVAAAAKGQSDWLKKHSAALVLKGHLFHPSNWTDSKYVTNLGLDNELMNSISC